MCRRLDGVILYKDPLQAPWKDGALSLTNYVFQVFFSTLKKTVFKCLVKCFKSPAAPPLARNIPNL